METHFTPLPQSVMTPVAENKQRSGNKIMPILAIVILLMIIGAVIIATSIGKKQNTSEDISAVVPTSVPTATPTLIPYPTLGSMAISTKEGTNRYQVDSSVNVILSATSDGKNIVTYDGIISYDKSAFSYVKAESIDADYKVFAYDRPTHVSLSGVKMIQDNTVSSWSNTPIVEVEFKALKKGSYVFDLAPVGKETSKLVDDKGQVVYPQSSPVKLEIY